MKKRRPIQPTNRQLPKIECGVNTFCISAAFISTSIGISRPFLKAPKPFRRAAVYRAIITYVCKFFLQKTSGACPYAFRPACAFFKKRTLFCRVDGRSPLVCRVCPCYNPPNF